MKNLNQARLLAISLIAAGLLIALNGQVAHAEIGPGLITPLVAGDCVAHPSEPM